MKRLVLFIGILFGMQVMHPAEDAITFISEEVDYELSGLSGFALTKLKDLSDETEKLLTISPPGFESGTYSNPKQIYDLLYDKFRSSIDAALRYFDMKAYDIIQEIMGLYDELPTISSFNKFNVLETSNTRNMFELIITAMKDEIKDELIDIKNDVLFGVSLYIDAQIDEYQRAVAQNLKIEVYSAPTEKKELWDTAKGVVSYAWADFKKEAFESKIDPETGECEKITDDEGSAKEYSLSFLTGDKDKSTVCRSLVDQFNNNIKLTKNNLVKDLKQELKDAQDEVKKDITEGIKNAPTKLKGFIKGDKKKDDDKQDDKDDEKEDDNGDQPAEQPDQEDQPDQAVESTALLFEEIAKPNPDIAIITNLINESADINAYDNNGWTPLLTTLGKQPRKEAIALKLLELGADPNLARNGKTPLMESVTKEYFQQEYGDTQVDETLIAKKATIDTQDNAGKTALLYAAQSYNLPSIKVLLDSFADPNITNRDGKNALSLVAEWYGNQKGEFVKQNKQAEFEDLALGIVNELINNDINVNNQSNIDKTTALMWFAAAEDANIVQALLTAGADTELTDIRGETVWEYTKPDSAVMSVLENKN